MGRRLTGAPSPFSRQIVKAIIRLRDEAGMTNVELIKRAGFSPNYFYLRLRGDTTFDTNDIEKIALVFNVSPAALMTIATSLTDEDDADKLVAVDRLELARRLGFLAAGPHADDSVLALQAGGAAITEEKWAALLSATGPRQEAHSLLTALAGHFDVSEAYLLELGSNEVAQRVEAEVDFQRALTESGANSVAARALGVVSPSALIAITEAIRSIDRRQ
ncbi:helix-turn-helix domain-containing protein [Subtercola boreus]|nr:helix-turn-helix transcriptional regulator [Subtercola boreus]